MIAVAAKDTAVAGALAIYPDDPTAAAIATTEALTGVLKSTLAGHSPGGPDTTSSTPSQYQSKLAQEAVLGGIIGNREGAGWEKEKSTLCKNAKLMPVFPGSACKTQPDVWEDYWEKSFRTQRTLESG